MDKEYEPTEADATDLEDAQPETPGDADEQTSKEL